MKSKWIEWLFPRLCPPVSHPLVCSLYLCLYQRYRWQGAIRVEVAETLAQLPWAAFGKAIGGVTPGDLFYIDATDTTDDIVLSLAKKATVSEYNRRRVVIDERAPVHNGGR